MTKGRSIAGVHSPKAKTDTWLTPRYILDALGPFDLDVCAAPEPRPWDTAKRHYTAPGENGLILPWEGRVWMNPPYGNQLGLWLHKLAVHGRGTSLIFARTDTAAFFDYVWQEADAVMFLRGRLHFHHADGTRASKNSGGPSVLVAYGAEDVERLLESGLDGTVVGLKRPVMLHLALQQDVPMPTWKALVKKAVLDLGGEATLQQLYEALQDHPRVEANPNYRAKIRQTLSRLEAERLEEGRYSMGRAA